MSYYTGDADLLVLDPDLVEAIEERGEEMSKRDVNAYRCKNAACLLTLKTISLHVGLLPRAEVCPQCGSEMQSAGSPLPVPAPVSVLPFTWEFYRPSAAEYAELVDPDEIQWVDKGGLLRRDAR